MNENLMNNIHKTLVVCMYGGPGVGKTTMACGVVSDLKANHINVEYVDEYVKHLVYQNRQDALNDQIYLFAKQRHRIATLLGKTDVIVTDSPFFMYFVYDKEQRPTLETLTVEEHNKMWTYNIFLQRIHPYVSEGRIQNEDGAKRIDNDILNLLNKHNQNYEVIKPNYFGKYSIIKQIGKLLKNKL